MRPLGKLRLVLYAAVPVVLVLASRWMPTPWFQTGCMDPFAVLSVAIGWSTLGGAVVLAGCLAWLGTGRSIPLVPILVAGGAPWFVTIGFRLGLWRLVLEEFGRHLDERAGLDLTLVLSAEFQSHQLMGLVATASLLLAAVLVLGVEALRELRSSGPAQSRPGRWHSKTAAALVAAARSLCLLAGLDAWVAVESLLVARGGNA